MQGKIQGQVRSSDCYSPVQFEDDCSIAEGKAQLTQPGFQQTEMGRGLEEAHHHLAFEWRHTLVAVPITIPSLFMLILVLLFMRQN